jgi:hypothetical protein
MHLGSIGVVMASRDMRQANQQQALSSFLGNYSSLCGKTVTGASDAHSSRSEPRERALLRFVLEQHKRAQISQSETSHIFPKPLFTLELKRNAHEENQGIKWKPDQHIDDTAKPYSSMVH